MIGGGAGVKQTTIYLPDDAHLALRMAALKKGIAMTELARQILLTHLKKAGYRVRRHTAPKTGRGNTRRK